MRSCSVLQCVYQYLIATTTQTRTVGHFMEISQDLQVVAHGWMFVAWFGLQEASRARHEADTAQKEVICLTFASARKWVFFVFGYSNPPGCSLMPKQCKRCGECV
jgi:hypothetical protein